MKGSNERLFLLDCPAAKKHLRWRRGMPWWWPGVLLAGWLMQEPGFPGDVAPFPNSSSTNAPASNSIAAAGRKHPSYQVFSANLRLPSVSCEPETGSLLVARKHRLPVAGPVAATAAEASAIAAECGVPLPVIQTFEKRMKARRASLEQCRSELGVTLTDYKFLEERWNSYRAGAQGQGLKTDALKALRAGEIDKAWELYQSLPRPRPPADQKPAP